MSVSAKDDDETSISTIKTDGGGFELTSKRILIYQDSKVASVIGGGMFGAIGGALGGVMQHRAGRKPKAEIPLAALTSVKAVPGKRGTGTMVLTFANGKEAPIPEIPDVVAFVAKIDAQLATLRAAAAPKRGAVITLDTRVKHLPGWQMLQHWPKAAFDGDPADVRLTIDAPTESAFLRTKEELGDFALRLVYRFPVLPRFAYVALRIRSREEGKRYALVRVNSKGELFAGTGSPQGNQPWTRHEALGADPGKPNELRVEVEGATMRVFANGALAITKDGIEGPTGRVVLGGGCAPTPAEISVGAFSIETA